MKKRTFKLLTLAFLLTTVMYNCKKKEEPFPDSPDSALITEINAIEVEEITVTAPAAVTSTESSITASPKATATATALASVTAGNIPPAVTTTAAEFSSVLTPAEIATLKAVDATALASIQANGTLPAALKAIVDKIAADPILKAYLPTSVLPTVAGVSISGTRVAANELVEAIAAEEIKDECLQKAQAAFDAVKLKLDNKKTSETAKVTAAYTAATAPLAAAETDCKAAVTVKYATLATQVITIFATTQTTLESIKTILGPELYDVYTAILNAQLVGYLNAIYNLKAADLKACTAKTTAATNNAAAARTADMAKVNANYAAALAKAENRRLALLQSCHNQGGGN